VKRLSLLLAALCVTQAWADTKISTLPAAATQVGTEILPEYQAGQCAATGGTCGVTPAQLKTYVLGTPTAHAVLIGEGASNLVAISLAVDTILQGQGASADPVALSIPNCGSASTALAYSTTTHAFSCQTISGGGTPTTLQGTSSSTSANYPIYAANGTTPVFDSLFTVSLNPGTHTINATTFSGNATSATIAATLTTTQSTTNAQYPPVLANGTTMQWDNGVLINPSTHDIAATTHTGAVMLTLTTIASLPTCNAGNKGRLQAVTDANAPAYNATIAGGGAVSVPVYCNGTNWTAH
jgi:hypothetical protein